jgi:hypothetical protein
VWTDAEKEKVKDLFYEGYSDAEIAVKLGRTALAVGIQRHHLRLHKAYQPAKEFRIHDAMADFYPSWYKKQLREEWLQQQEQSTSSK